MLTFNASQKCLCSRPKLASKNFCNECWGMIPEELRLRYVQCAEDLHKITLECARSAKPVSRKKPNPELGQRIYEARRSGAAWMEVARENLSSYASVYKRAATYASAKGLPFPI